jgi:hypothetical protein
VGAAPGEEDEAKGTETEDEAIDEFQVTHDVWAARRPPVVDGRGYGLEPGTGNIVDDT